MTFQKTLQKISEMLPEVYRNWLPNFFQTTIPEETLATCFDCAMCQKPGRGISNGNYFLQDTKCCTFHPALPNYLVGGLLSNTDPRFSEGRRRIREKINQRIGIIPHGIFPSSKYLLLYDKSRSVAFGKSKSLLCPYYEKENGLCTVWPFRESICATYYCKTVAGEKGHSFWATSRKYLSLVENALTSYTLYKMGWPPEKITRQSSSPDPSPTLEDLEEQPPKEKIYQEQWGDWVGREADFYKETSRLVAPLTPKDFERILGISSVILLEELKQKHQEMVTTKLPQMLKRNPNLKVEKISTESYALTSYSPTNPLEVGSLIYMVLDFFDGRCPHEEVLKRIRDQVEVELDEDLLLCLYQFRILVDAE